MYVTTESVNLDLEWNGIFLDMYLPLPGCVALPQNAFWKQGADEAAADRSPCSHSAPPNKLFLKIGFYANSTKFCRTFGSLVQCLGI